MRDDMIQNSLNIRSFRECFPYEQPNNVCTHFCREFTTGNNLYSILLEYCIVNLCNLVVFCNRYDINSLDQTRVQQFALRGKRIE